MQRAIVGFHRDELDDWVAELACGHGQHMRHDPPWQSRPWTLTAAGRASRLGETVHCRKCERGEPRAPWASEPSASESWATKRPADRGKDRAAEQGPASGRTPEA